MNISWHFFFPGCSTTPWQLEGVIRAMLKDGYSRELIHACHNRAVVIDAHRRLFANWGEAQPDAEGRFHPDVGEPSARLVRKGMTHFREGLRLIGMAVAESPRGQAEADGEEGGVEVRGGLTDEGMRD